MQLAALDWLVIAAYVVVVLWIGARWSGRAGRSVEEFFLAGRSLPWWLAGTSMVATSFAADTPLVVTGWVREHGLWKNWLWWCYAVAGALHVFVFARRWRRGGVLTKAELVELRYGGRGAALLRGALGVLHGGVTNVIILCWVLLAAAKILDVLLGLDKVTALALSCSVALAYSVTAGFWGVVLTDLPQFLVAMTGAIALALAAWGEAGGAPGVLAAAQAGAPFHADTLAFLPQAGPGGPLDASFWTVPLAAFAVYLGVSWWAAEDVDGSGATVQRLAAARDERQATLAVLWYNVAHYALRPWVWITVALASLVLLPPVELRAPAAGTVRAVEPDAVLLDTAGGPLRLPLQGPADDWRPHALVEPGQPVAPDQLVARTDSERAYVVMLARYLPAGLLGLAVAGLLAAFMSTVDTHVNLAASFIVNDVWRRFVARDADQRHLVRVARWTSLVVMAAAALVAAEADSISGLFQFFLALLGGVGPVYLLRWVWWRIRAQHELVAMATSFAATVTLTFSDTTWSLGPLSPGGVLAPEGRLLLVVGASLAAVGVALLLVPAPDPRGLVEFYRRVRPVGAWGPVAALAPDVRREGEGRTVLLGVAGGLALVYGATLGIGLAILQRTGPALLAGAVALAGALAVRAALTGGKGPAG